MIFLPKGASIVDVSPVHHEDKVAWQFFMAADLRPLHINPIQISPQRAVPMLHHIQKYPEWHQLAPKYRSSTGDICKPSEDSVHLPKGNVSNMRWRAGSAF